MYAVPYLNFNGTCREAFEFYAEVLGGEITQMQTFGETPAKEHVPSEMHDKIIHARLKVEGAVLMASDDLGDWKQPQGFLVALVIADADKAKRVFDALAEGGTVTMPYQETFWSKGFGMAIDKYGTPWAIDVDDKV